MQLALFPGSLHTNRWETLVALPTPYDSQIINMVVDTNWKVTAHIKLPWHGHCFSTYVRIWLTQTVNKKIYTASLPYVNVWKYNWAIHSLIPVVWKQGYNCTSPCMHNYVRSFYHLSVLIHVVECLLQTQNTWSTFSQSTQRNILTC